MSERLRQSLSALMDDAADDLELGRILRAMDEGDSELREAWSRYHLVGAVMRGQDSVASQRTLTLDEMLEREARHDPVGAAGIGSVNDTQPAAAPRSRPWRAVASFAMAASVTAVAVVGWQWQGSPAEGPAVASSSQSATGNVQGSRAQLTEVPEWSGRSSAVMPASQAPNEPLVLERSLRQGASVDATASHWGAVDVAGSSQSVEFYILQHAEKNALHSGSGMMPFARMASFEGAP